MSMVLVARGTNGTRAARILRACLVALTAGGVWLALLGVSYLDRVDLGDYALSTLSLRTVLLASVGCYAVLYPGWHVTAALCALPMLAVGLLGLNNLTLGHSYLASCWTLVGVLALARGCGLRISQVEAGPAAASRHWRPNIMQLIGVTTAVAAVFALSGFQASDAVSFWYHIKWPIITYSTVMLSGLILLSRLTLTARAIILLMVTCLGAVALAEPTRIDSRMSWTIVAELLVSLGWCLIVFGWLRVLGWRCCALTRDTKFRAAFPVL